MQRYEAYKPSGVEWLGDIPENWDVCRNIGLFDERKEINRPDMELLSVTINRGVIRQEEIAEKKDSSNEDKSKYKVVRKDDLAYNKMRMWQGAIGRSEYEGIVSPAYVILAPRDNLYSRYYHYLYRTEAFIAEANRHSYGLCLDMNSLRYEDFKTIYSPVPPRTEVERIVAFLDQKTAEIDAAIAKKERLIELLQEQKKTVRNQVITKGLNLSALQCDSGVPWIGAIPSHWKVCAIKRLFKSMDYGLSESALGDGDFKYLNMGHIKDGKVSTENTGYLASAPDALLLRKNDILFNRTNSFDLVGKSGIYLSDEENVTFASYMVRIRVKDEICPSWANSLMNSESYLSFIRTLALRSLNQANLNPTRLGAVSVPVPPKEEQEAIADYLDEMSTQVDISIRSIEKELCGLFEMKQTTIANVVTGKIKV